MTGALPHAASVMVVVMRSVGGLLFLALGTERADLGLVRGQGVARLGDSFGQLAAHGGVGHFGYRAASGADHQ